MQGHRAANRKSVFDWKSSTDEIECVDFVRGVSEPGTGEKMHRRLASDEARAARVLRSWRRVAELGRRDRELDEIARRREALHLAKTVGRHHLATAARPAAVVLVAKLAFGHRPLDGRRGVSSARHWVFEVEDFVCDIRFDASRRRAQLDGQVTAATEPGESKLDSMAVLVLRGDELLTSVACDEAGEFHTGALPRWPSHLEVLVQDGMRIEVPLQGADAAAEG